MCSQSLQNSLSVWSAPIAAIKNHKGVTLCRMDVLS
jgi:hypothetical protein